MTESRLVRIASRWLAIYLSVWALFDCTYLPQYILSLVHHLGESGIRDQDYWKDYYLLETASLVLRIAAASLGAVYFWNCGPQLACLFLPAEDEVRAIAERIAPSEGKS